MPPILGDGKQAHEGHPNPGAGNRPVNCVRPESGKRGARLPERPDGVSHTEQEWLAADHPIERRMLEIVCLNCTLDGATLVPEMRKPFDVLADGLVSENSRGDRTAIELFIAGVRGWEAGFRSPLGGGTLGHEGA